jgi:hypothetical protein
VFGTEMVLLAIGTTGTFDTLGTYNDLNGAQRLNGWNDWNWATAILRESRLHR